MQVNGYHHMRVKKVVICDTKLIPVAPDNILKSCEAKRLVCARNWTLTVQETLTFINCNAEHQANGEVQFFSINWNLKTEKKKRIIIMTKQTLQIFYSNINANILWGNCHYINNSRLISSTLQTAQIKMANWKYDYWKCVNFSKTPIYHDLWCHDLSREANSYVLVA